MSVALLVRHAQASWLSDDYDRLSPLGERQARQLGRTWARHGLEPDRLLSGPRQRQLRTAELLREEMLAAGSRCAAVDVLPAFDEYPAEALVPGLLPVLADRDPRVADWVAKATGDGDRAVRSRATELLLRSALSVWSEGHRVPGVESFEEFRARARRALDAVVESGRGKRIAVVSSGGILGMVVGEVLGLDHGRRLELGTLLHNTGVAELLYGAGRVSMARWDALDHLPDPADRTRR